MPQSSTCMDCIPTTRHLCNAVSASMDCIPTTRGCETRTEPANAASWCVETAVFIRRVWKKTAHTCRTQNRKHSTSATGNHLPRQLLSFAKLAITTTVEACGSIFLQERVLRFLHSKTRRAPSSPTTYTSQPKYVCGIISDFRGRHICWPRHTEGVLVFLGQFRRRVCSTGASLDARRRSGTATSAR